MSIAAMPMTARAIGEPGGAVPKIQRPPPRRQAVARADADVRPEPR
jgi:hypothetical protein